MNNYLERLLLEIPGLNKEGIDNLLNIMPVRDFTRGHILLRQGDIIKNCYYIFKGCIREYKIDVDGNERTTNFYFSNDSVAQFPQNSSSESSRFFWECVTDTTLLVGDLSMERDILIKYPQVEEFTRGILEVNIGKVQDKLALFIESTPQERVEALLKVHPEIFDYAPQYQIASYLGLTPESLSRIRKRLL